MCCQVSTSFYFVISLILWVSTFCPFFVPAQISLLQGLFFKIHASSSLLILIQILSGSHNLIIEYFFLCMHLSSLYMLGTLYAKHYEGIQSLWR